MPLLDLYLAKSFEDLEAYVTVPEFKSAKLMCNSAAKLYMEAERSFVIGDHERSYVLFGKYFKTILPLKKRDDYRRNKAELDGILGPQSKQLRAIEIMSELRDNLVDRYDKMKTKPTERKGTSPLPPANGSGRLSDASPQSNVIPGKSQHCPMIQLVDNFPSFQSPAPSRPASICDRTFNETRISSSSTVGVRRILNDHV